MKPLLLFLLALGLFMESEAQKTKPASPSKKGTTSKKSPARGGTGKATTRKDERPVVELIVVGENGNTYEPLFQGDQLVYRVNAQEREYDFIVTLDQFSYEGGIDFSYAMTNALQTSGVVHIEPGAYQSSKAYSNYFTGGPLKLSHASTVWMCYDNFMDMPNRKTEMSFDGAKAETFYRPEQDEVRPEINWKGKKVKIDAFQINNAEDGKGNKTLWIHNISANPLILRMDLGWTIELKEIRSAK